MSLIKEAKVQYDSKQDVIEKYQNLLKKNKKVADKEQKWADKYLTTIIDFMGHEDTWKIFVNNVEIRGSGGRASTRGIPVSNKPCAVFSGAHWRSRKANEDKWFDTYDHYQINGTNQFCQTFAMMHLTDSLPLPEKDGWKRNYKYSKAALEYINNCVMAVEFDNKDYQKDLRKAVEVCMKNSNACVNIIEYPTF